MAAPAAKPADLTGSLHACLSLQDGNNISGPLPVGGNSMESLQTVFVRPGNPLLCAASNAPPFRWAPGLPWHGPAMLCPAPALLCLWNKAGFLAGFTVPGCFIICG